MASTHICVISVARSDYSIILPILKGFEKNPSVKVSFVLSGMHLSPEFGNTLSDVLGDGWDQVETIEHLVSSDTPVGFSKSIGLGIISYADFFAKLRPDIIFLTGDRAEMLAAGLAAIPFGIPIAHIHGGETTEGAIDEVFRHSITKMSALHFVSTKDYAKRVAQLGECPSRIFVSGAPALDNISSCVLLSKSMLASDYGIFVERKPIIVTLHPETFHLRRSIPNVEGVVRALKYFDNQVVFTSSNADATGRQINQLIKQEVANNANWLFLDNLSTNAYYSVLSVGSAMVGNSSSGIIEAASFNLEVVNVGDRQKGRVRGKNVIDVSNDYTEIKDALSKILNGSDKSRPLEFENPYFNGGASDIIVTSTLSALRYGLASAKKFHDLEQP